MYILYRHLRVYSVVGHNHNNRHNKDYSGNIYENYPKSDVKIEL